MTGKTPKPPKFRCHSCGETTELQYMPKISKRSWHLQRCPKCGKERK